MHRSDGQSGAGADADDRRLRFGWTPARDRRCLSLCCTLRIGLFLRHQPIHDLAQCGQQGVGIGTLGRNTNGIALAKPELQQRHQTLGIGHLIARAHLRTGRETPRRLCPARGRARVQSTGVSDGPVEALGQVRHRHVGCRDRDITGQRIDDVARIGGGEQPLQRGLILDQPGQAAQQGNVGIGLGSDANHHTGDLPRIPFHAFRQLQHGNAIAAHQMAVLAKPVRDCHTMAEEGVGQRFAPSHAGLVPRRHAAGRDQHLRDLGDRIGLVLRPRVQADQFPADGGGEGLGRQRAAPAKRMAGHIGNVPTAYFNVHCTKCQ